MEFMNSKYIKWNNGRILTTLFFLMGIFLIANLNVLHAQSATYYVSPTGSNSNSTPGTINQPFASLARVVEYDSTKPSLVYARAGDTVLVCGGTYLMNEVLIDRNKGRGGGVAGGGNPGDYLTIKNYTGPSTANCQNASAPNLPFLRKNNRRFIVWADYVHIEGLHLEMDWYLDIFGQSNRIINNTFTGEQPKFGAILTGGSNTLIEDNTIALVPGGNTQDHGLYVQAGSNVIIRGNVVSGMQGYGIHIYHEHKSTNPAVWQANPIRFKNYTIENNIVHSSNQRSGIFLGLGTNRGFPCCISMEDMMIRNNIVYNNQGNGILVRRGDRVQVYNNTVYNNRAWPASSAQEASGIDVENGTNVDIQNNIIVSPAPNRPHIVNTSNNTVTARNNLYNTTPNFRGITDPQAQIGNAQFANPAAGDFHLTQNSAAAMDKGLTLSSVAIDFEGTPRPQGTAYDIGADELGPPSNNQPPSKPSLDLSLN